MIAVIIVVLGEVYVLSAIHSPTHTACEGPPRNHKQDVAASDDPLK